MIVAAPPVAPIVAANAIKIFRVTPLPTVTLASEAVAGLAVPAAAVAAETGALALVAPLAVVAGLALVGGAAWWLWNQNMMTRTPYLPPRKTNGWFLRKNCTYCKEYFPGLGMCIAWDEGGHVENEFITGQSAVSYTHLTLPTKA